IPYPIFFVGGSFFFKIKTITYTVYKFLKFVYMARQAANSVNVGPLFVNRKHRYKSKATATQEKAPQGPRFFWCA
ncbi:hypothetical protein, partial [Enterobacter intestinihominis]